MKKTKTAMILSFVILMLASCSDKENADNTKNKAVTSTETTPAVTTTTLSETTAATQTTTAETSKAETSAAEKEPYILIDPDNVPDGAVQTGEHNYNMTLEKVSDNEYKTPDGNFKVTVNYEIIDNKFNYDLLWTNTSDKTLEFSFNCDYEARTDLTDPSFNMTFIPEKGIYEMKPGETWEYSDSGDLEEGYSTVEATLWVNAWSTEDDNGNTITYSVDPYPLVINYSE